MDAELEPHNIKFPKRLWADAKAIADARYKTMTEVLRDALVRYVEEYGAANPAERTVRGVADTPTSPMSMPEDRLHPWQIKREGERT